MKDYIVGYMALMLYTLGTEIAGRDFWTLPKGIDSALWIAGAVLTLVIALFAAHYWRRRQSPHAEAHR